MMMRTKNFDRYANDVARMRESEREGVKKPVVTAQPIPPVDSGAQQPTPVQLIKPDYMELLIETVKMEGRLMVFSSELPGLLGLPETNDKAAILSFVEAARPKLLAAGIYCFSFRHPTAGSHGAITFRMLELDSLRHAT